MPLCVIWELFPNRLDAIVNLVNLNKTPMKLMACNGMDIPRLSDSQVEW